MTRNIILDSESESKRNVPKGRVRTGFACLNKGRKRDWKSRESEGEDQKVFVRSCGCCVMTGRLADWGGRENGGQTPTREGR